MKRVIITSYAFVMKLLIYFLLISFLSIINVKSTHNRLLLTEAEMEMAIKSGLSDIIRSDVNLTFSSGGAIFTSPYQNVLVWKGTYNNKEVAIKITEAEYSFNLEVNAYKSLKATGSLNVEQYHIPKVYYHGPVLNKFGNYFAIAMTLFQESLRIRFELQNRTISEPTILLIFVQTVKALSYIHSKNVYHGDLHMGQIFLRGKNEAFIGDFNMGAGDKCRVKQFLHLLSIMCELTGYPAERLGLYNVEKCFKNQTVRDSILEVLKIKEKLNEKTILKGYKNIIKILEKALESLSPVSFEWFDDSASSSAAH